MTIYQIIRDRYNDPPVFIDRLRASMRTHKVTQAALSERSGCDPTHVSRWVNGVVPPSLKTMLVLDEALEKLIEG